MKELSNYDPTKEDFIVENCDIIDYIKRNRYQMFKQYIQHETINALKSKYDNDNKE